MKPVLCVLTLFLLVLQVFSTPVPHSKHGKSEKEKILYDQRQEGEWNIRADLKNFVIVIIPKTTPEETTPSASLLDFFRTHGKHHAKHTKNAQKRVDNINEVGAETMHFIESKTAPYHVDISKSASHLLNDEILATQTPPVALALKTTEKNSKTTEENSKTTEAQPEKATAALLRQLRSTRFSKAFVLTVPEEEFVLTKMEDDKKVVKKDGIKKKLTTKNKEEMKLLGATEQCGPEMYRDSEGVCRLRKLPDDSESNESIDRNE